MRLATGDLVLFTQQRRTSWWLIDKAIEMLTRSPFVHVGMVLVDPPFSVPRGTYLWESGYESSPNPETGTRNLGVRLTEIGAAIGDSDVIVRRCTRRIAARKLTKIHRDVFLKPYDVCLSDWLLATLRLDARPQKTDRFWCSAFIAYVLARLGWLSDTTDWSIVRPCDLSSGSTYLSWDLAAAYTRDTPYHHTLEASESAIEAAIESERETERQHARDIRARERLDATERCDQLVAKLASIGVATRRVSDTDAQIKFPRGAIDVATDCKTGTFEARTSCRGAHAPRSFGSQAALVRYITEVLDAHLMAVIM